MMFWCHNCTLIIHELHGCFSCPRCHSSALQQDSGPDCPFDFQPFLIRPSLLSLLPPTPPPHIDLSQFDGPVRIRVETTLLQSVQDPGRIRVIRQYFVLPDTDFEEKKPVDKEVLASLERIEEFNDCAICQDDHSDKALVLPCEHTFHEKCITPWLSETNTCPCCRATV